MDMSFLAKEYFGNPVSRYLIAFAVFLAVMLLSKVVIRSALTHLEKFTKKTTNTFDDFIFSVLQKIVLPFFYFSALYISSKVLVLPAAVDRAMNVFEMALGVVFGGRLVMALIDFAFSVYCDRTKVESNLRESFAGLLRALKAIVWGIIAIFFLDNLGFKVSTVVAGLGIGGVAVALAAQTLLKDFFSYFSILLDRPFKLGDFIIIGDYMGTVEHVGIKTTRIASLGGEQIIMSNTDLTDSRVRNYKRMAKRRVVFRLGVVYDTPLADLKEIPGIIERVIKRVKDTQFDRAHFFSYADFSLIFEVVYYVLSPDYNKYMDIQQEINFAIREEFDKKKVVFAYPTQTLYVNKAAK